MEIILSNYIANNLLSLINISYALIFDENVVGISDFRIVLLFNVARNSEINLSLECCAFSVVH